MHRRKKKKILRNNFVICITAIAMLNFMGASYGAWNDNINLQYSISTGSINPEFYLDGLYDISGLSLSLSRDKSVLYLEGEAYPGFNKNVNLRVINKGSIPVLLNREIVDANETTEISIPIYIPEQKLEMLNVNIKPDDGNNMIIPSSQDIYELTEKLDVVRDYKFIYELQFDQGL